MKLNCMKGGRSREKMAVISTGLRHADDSCRLFFRRFRAGDDFTGGFRFVGGNRFYITNLYGFRDADGFDHSHAHVCSDRFAHTDRDGDTDRHPDWYAFCHPDGHTDGIAYAKADAPAHNEPYGQPGSHGHTGAVI